MCNRINKKHKVAFKVDENVPQKAIDVYHSIKVYYDKSDDYHVRVSYHLGLTIFTFKKLKLY